MTGENPYAPPAVAEPEAASCRYWQTHGTSLVVRNGTTLPKVDLETGANGETQPLRPIRRVLQNVTARVLVRIITIVTLYLILTTYFEIGLITFYLYLLVGSIVLRRLSALRGTTSGVISIWTFTEERRARRAVLRRWVQLGSLFLLIAIIFLKPVSVDWMLQGYFIWLALMIAFAIWALLDKPKFKLRADRPGWLRITPIHPAALAFLQAVEREQAPDETSPARKRLVRTVFYHRYPLRLLIGPHIRNPLVILRAALMKLLRSRLLVRDAWHFSEADDIPLENLSPPLRVAAESWLDTHPGWSFVRATHLPSPAGDLTIQTAMLASPGLEHCARVTRAWLEQTPAKGINSFAFLTWLADGNHSSTSDQPILTLKNPALHHRANGSPDAVFQTHLQSLNGHPILPAADPAEFKSRLLREAEETDRLLTEKGLQSETREA